MATTHVNGIDLYYSQRGDGHGSNTSSAEHLRAVHFVALAFGTISRRFRMFVSDASCVCISPLCAGPHGHCSDKASQTLPARTRFKG